MQLPESLIKDWRGKYGKNGDQRIRDLMLNDLKGAE
jgi:hypothetical protein